AGTADRGHRSHAFVSGDEGRLWLDGPIALRGVEVRVANPGRRDANEDLVLVRLRNSYFLKRELLAEFADDRSFHRVAHRCFLSYRRRRGALIMPGPARVMASKTSRPPRAGP